MRFLESFLAENTTPEVPTKPTKPILSGEISTLKVPTKPTKPSSVGFVGTGTLVSRGKNAKPAEADISRKKSISDLWIRPTPLVDAILIEIVENRVKGLEWNSHDHNWQLPKPRERRRRSNEPITAVDVIRSILPGARMIGPEPTTNDLAEMAEEASHWRREADGTWASSRRSDQGLCPLWRQTR